MIQQDESKIGSRELFALIVFIIAFKVTDMTPVILFKEGKNSSWILPVLSGLVIIIPLLVLLNLLNKYKDKGIIEIIYLLTGKYIGFIIALFLFLFYLADTAVNSRNYVDIMSTMFFSRSPIIGTFSILLIGGFFIAKQGLEGIGRTAWFFLGAQVIVAGTLFVLSGPLMDTYNIFPIAGPGIKELFVSGVKNSPILSDIFIFAAVFPFVRTYKDFKKSTLLGLGTSILTMVVYFIVFELVFDYFSMEIIAFPYQQLTAYVKVGRFITNIEGLYFFFWTLASVIRFAIYIYLTTLLFAQTFKLKEFKPLLLPMTWLIILLGMLPTNYVQEMFTIRQKYLLNGTWAVFILLPLILLSISKLRGEKVE
jgi:spore germination protein (amino acid permease)